MERESLATRLLNFVEYIPGAFFFRENCETATAKSIRKFYRRPYFLPAMAEAAAENWIFAAHGSKNDGVKMRWEYVRYYICY